MLSDKKESEDKRDETQLARVVIRPGEGDRREVARQRQSTAKTWRL